MKKILVIGGASRHLQRWFHYVVPELGGDTVVDLYCTADKIFSYNEASHIFRFENKGLCNSLLMKIPKLGGRIKVIYSVQTICKLLREGDYQVLNIHQPAVWEMPIVEYAKSVHCKVIVTPWGSDLLRCPANQQWKMKKILDLADHITFNVTDFKDNFTKMYCVDESKLLYAGFGSEIYDLILQYKGKYSKQELAKALNVPKGSYYIACGYTAQRAQRHIQMVKALGENKEFLPKGSVLLFQFTYGNNTDLSYQQELTELCEKFDLRYKFFTSYLSNEDMAKYRLMCDLFLHLQPTDAANASLQEFLLAGTQVVNGKWLHYPKLEAEGVPYHICESLEELSSLLYSFFNKELPERHLSENLSNSILSGTWSNQKKNWVKVLL